MVRVGLRRDAVTEIEDQRSMAEMLQNIVDTLFQRPTAGNDAHRIEIALHRAIFLKFSGKGQWNRPVEADRIGTGLLTIGFQLIAGALGEGDDARMRPLRFDRSDHPRNRPDREGFELLLPENPSPGIEDLHGVGAGVDLGDKIVGRHVSQQHQQMLEGAGIFVGEEAGGGLVRRAVPGDHIGRNRPGRAAEAEQGRLIRQGLAQPSHRFQNRSEISDDLFPVQSCDPGFIDRIHLRPMPFGEPHIPFHCIGDDQNIGKQDGRIEAIATDRLERHLDGVIGRVTEIEKTSGLCPCLSIFRQITSRLPHQPERRRAEAFAIENPHDLSARVAQALLPYKKS
ncbi:hypothetical protein RHECNPAF_3340036 [Rhizobium etli CNPAF512]|nr:hypothetical protein RHECNPAF_3340036 [Rhizobium etli CNPAF512]